MADKNKNEYLDYITSVISSLDEDTYNYFNKLQHGGEYDFGIYSKTVNKVVDSDWLNMFEDCIISLDNIVRNPRKFIALEEDIVPIALAKKVAPESIRHLAQHTNYIASYDSVTDTVIPEKILNINKEESFDIYENRFVYTLLLRCVDFLDKRITLIEKSGYDADIDKVNVCSKFDTPKHKFNFNLQYEAQQNILADDFIPSTETEVGRVMRLQSIFAGFMGSTFAKVMRGSAPVRPPITRTNVILKNPDFKKALSLWQFVETYTKPGYTVEYVETDVAENESQREKFNKALFLNYILFKDHIGDKQYKSTKAKVKLQLKNGEYMLKKIVETYDITQAEIKRMFAFPLTKLDLIPRDMNTDINAIIDEAIAWHKDICEIERIDEIFVSELVKHDDDEQIKKVELEKFEQEERERVLAEQKLQAEEDARKKAEEKARLIAEKAKAKEEERLARAKERAEERAKIAEDRAREKEKERLLRAEERIAERVRLAEERAKAKEQEREELALQKAKLAEERAKERARERALILERRATAREEEKIQKQIELTKKKAEEKARRDEEKALLALEKAKEKEQERELVLKARESEWEKERLRLIKARIQRAEDRSQDIVADRAKFIEDNSKLIEHNKYRADAYKAKPPSIGHQPQQDKAKNSLNVDQNAERASLREQVRAKEKARLAQKTAGQKKTNSDDTDRN